jgi:galactose-1-phosphate uridylyltransferase
MEFKVVTRNSLFFDPFNNFELTKRPTEFRFDPLLEKATRIIYFPVTLPPPPDQTAIAEATQPFCPFCRPAVFEKTPRFTEEIAPEGRIEHEDAVVFPNAFPYDQYSAVGVVGEEHFVALDSFNPAVLGNAFTAATEYLRRVYTNDAQYRHHSINMNYMPLAGGSIIHPHIQIIAGDIPTNYQRAVELKTGEYKERVGSRFFHDLVSEEKKRGERFIAAVDGISWLSAFAPMGITEFIAVFDTYSPLIAMDGASFVAFSEKLVRIFSYLAQMNFMSFNLAVYSAPPDTKKDDAPYPTHARIIPRTQLPPLGASDINYFEMLHHEVLTIIKPEDAAAAVRDSFL